jgi:hypothetical protein
MEHSTSFGVSRFSRSVIVNFAIFSLGAVQLTGKRQPYPGQNTELEGEDVEDKVAVVVVRYAVVHPRTVTVGVSSV